MVSIAALWLPILLAAVLVFLASSVLHMVLSYHQSDFGQVPREDEVMDALRPFAIPPGDYVVPCPGDSKEMASPEYLEKTSKGPVAFLTVIPNGPPQMGKSLAQWFVYCLAVGVFVAYLAGRTLDGTADYMTVFRLTGTTAFIAYAVGLWQTSIWYHRSWSATAKSTVDGLVYGLLTAGAFGWLWPG